MTVRHAVRPAGRIREEPRTTGQLQCIVLERERPIVREDCGISARHDAIDSQPVEDHKYENLITGRCCETGVYSRKLVASWHPEGCIVNGRFWDAHWLRLNKMNVSERLIAAIINT
jgi:hypothetical protein